MCAYVQYTWNLRVVFYVEGAWSREKLSSDILALFVVAVAMLLGDTNLTISLSLLTHSHQGRAPTLSQL